MKAYGFSILLLLTWTQRSISYMVPGEEKKDGPQLPNPLGSLPKMQQLGQMQEEQRMMMPQDSMNSMTPMNSMGPIKMMNPPPGFTYPMAGLGSQQPSLTGIKTNVGSMLKNAMEGFQFTSETATDATTSMAPSTEVSSDQGQSTESAEFTTAASEEMMSTTASGEEAKGETTNEPGILTATKAESSESGEDSTETTKPESDEESARTSAQESDKVLDMLKETKILDLINIPSGLMDCDNEKNLFCSMVTLGKEITESQAPKFREMMMKIAEFVKDLKQQKPSPAQSNGEDPPDGETDIMFDDTDAPKILAHLDTIRKTVNNMEALIKMAEKVEMEADKAEMAEKSGMEQEQATETVEKSETSERPEMAENETSALGEQSSLGETSAQ